MNALGTSLSDETTIGEPGLPRLVGLGLLAAALFSATFVLNRMTSLAGGHWAWSAALRYFDMVPLLAGWIALRSGPAALLAALRLFGRHLGFWLVAGGVGFGLFYGGICFAADHAPGWVVAATWQSTILATPLVLLAFGSRVPVRGVLFALVIFLGILILNARQIAAGVPADQVILGVLPVLIAAVAYPTGNQLLNRARHGLLGPDAASILRDPAASVLLLTLGSLPVFVAGLLAIQPPAPTSGQIASTAAVAMLAGGLATTLFLYARNLSSDPLRIAAVDATQAGEVSFALAGEMVVLGAPAPDGMAWLGLAAMTGGLVGFTLTSTDRSKGATSKT